ncbi:MAG: 4Fe-4S dicluster domain-containing protein [Myxococcales bacterium]|nr:4Fe-4S dicluster domain-containing protein [Myxococcales bacterium]
MLAGDPAAMLAPGLRAGYAQIRQLPLFDGVPNEILIGALGVGDLQLRAVERDAVVADPDGLAPGTAPPVVVLLSGQVAAGVFDPHELAERKAVQADLERMTHDERESVSLIKPIPMARLAKKNVALFTDGDLWNSGAVAAARGAPVAFFATAPSVVVTLAQRLVSDVAVRFPFFEARFRRAITMSRQRLHGITGVKQEILDFFVRQGISVSGESVRVRQLDRCIDCKQCEIACEERYGARRLTLGGYQLGMLDFVYTCRTCTDQRCIDPCAYDSIKFDPVKKEVVINDATCTGCSACAQSCPYGAIDMIDVEDGSPAFNKDFRARLEKAKALAFGPGTGRVARVRRIANKCDHCGAYGDQACVSACPTGALIEISAYDLFRERSPAVAAAARAGFDQDLDGDRREVLPTHPFTEGVDERSGGSAKVRRGRWGPLLLWVVGIVVWLIALAEVLLRLYAPTMSYQYSQLRATPELANLPAELIVQKVGFRSGNELAIQCGLVGTGLMIIAAIYPMFRRLRAFRWLASNTMWFDFHMMAGTVGPMFIALHSALRLSSWVSLAFWSMVIVTVSGIIGRYLYTQVPELSSGRELEQLDHARAFAHHRGKHPVAASEIDRELWEHGQRAARVAERYGLLLSLGWLLVEDLRRPGRWLARRSRLGRVGVTGKARRDLVRRAGRMLLIQRGAVIAPKANLLLNSWKKVHVPFTVLLTIFSAAHIYISWDRAW